MGLIRAASGAAGGMMADQWKEYFYCEAMPENVMAVKGQKRVSGRSSNYKGSENIISNGSVIAVADGQCMIIVDQGKVMEMCAECGNPKPAGVPQYKCDKCGWKPADPANPPKFCPECGDPFNDGDLK